MKLKGILLAILMSLTMAFAIVPQMAGSTYAEDVEIDPHDPYSHSSVSRITQEYGLNTIYLQCEWEQDTPTAGKHVCQFHEWPLIVMNMPDTYYDGTPKEPSLYVEMMRNYPDGKRIEGLPDDFAKTDGVFTYTGINGTVEYGPTDKAPVGEGTYYVCTTVTIPGAVTSTNSGEFVLGKTFTIMPSSYDVYFDTNVPNSASTKIKEASMPILHFNSLLDERQLPPNQFDLPGYTFDSWNTEPDGTGTRYENNDMVKGLSKNGRDVTLYAQWKPKTYSITYSPGDAIGDTFSESAVFDKTGKLKTVSETGFLHDNGGFLGWKIKDSKIIYDGGASFVNLCGAPDSYGNNPSNVELVAQWVEDNQIIAVVNKDDKPWLNMGDFFKLKSKDGTVYTIPVSNVDDGAYTFDPTRASQNGKPPSQLPPGEYELHFTPAVPGNNYPSSCANIVYGPDQAASAVFNYYTVSLKADPAYKDVHQVMMAEITPDEEGCCETIALPGNKLKLKTFVNPGYHFDEYSVVGVTPSWEEGDNRKAEQTIEVQGKADIVAHVKANSYKVVFDANTKAPVIGEIEDQDMVYDEPQNLFANQFVRSGFVFAGWNTKADGTGSTYSDGQSVKNLTTEDNATTKLYAQWKPIPETEDETSSTPNINNAPVVLDDAPLIYTGKPITPVILTIGGKSLQEGRDYTVRYTQGDAVIEAPTDAGIYTMTITGRGNYAGSTSTEFTIGKAAGTLTAKGNKVKAKSKTVKLKKAKKISADKAYTIEGVIGELAFIKVKANKASKQFKVNATTGQIKAKKGLKKGKYELTVLISDSGDKNHEAAEAQAIVKIKVKK